MLLVNDAHYPPIAFSTGLPGEIQPSRLPDPRSARDNGSASVADEWKEEIGRKTQNIESHDIYRLTSCVKGAHSPVRLVDWTFKVVFEKEVRLVALGNHQRPGIDYHRSRLHVQASSLSSLSSTDEDGHQLVSREVHWYSTTVSGNKWLI